MIRLFKDNKSLISKSFFFLLLPFSAQSIIISKHLKRSELHRDQVNNKRRKEDIQHNYLFTFKECLIIA